jgi:hypothetical protein
MTRRSFGRTWWKGSLLYVAALVYPVGRSGACDGGLDGLVRSGRGVRGRHAPDQLQTLMDLSIFMEDPLVGHRAVRSRGSPIDGVGEVVVVKVHVADGGGDRRVAKQPLHRAVHHSVTRQ